MKKKTQKTDFSPILEKIPSDKKMIGEKLISELSFMEETLADLKDQIRKTGETELSP